MAISAADVTLSYLGQEDFARQPPVAGDTKQLLSRVPVIEVQSGRVSVVPAVNAAGGELDGVEPGPKFQVASACALGVGGAVSLLCLAVYVPMGFSIGLSVGPLLLTVGIAVLLATSR
jgi:hypothetical protein